MSKINLKPYLISNKLRNVDEVIGEGGNMESTKVFKQNLFKTFDVTGFNLRKWKEKDHLQRDNDEVCSKQHLSKEDAKVENRCTLLEQTR